MYPILFNIGSFPVHSYGVLIALGFLSAVWFARSEGYRLGLNGELIVDLGFWSLLLGMVGARILYVITRFSYMVDHPGEIFAIWEGGLVFFGGVLICFPFFLWYTKKHKLPTWAVLDLCAVGVPLAHAFGRMGCLSAGCCYGKPTDMPWGITFHGGQVEPHLYGLPLHPTQIYESLSVFALFAFLFWYRKRKRFDGELLCIYFIVYSIIRSTIEIFRGDTIRGFVVDGWLSTSQFISILTIIGFAVLYAWRKKVGLLTVAPTRGAAGK